MLIWTIANGGPPTELSAAVVFRYEPSFVFVFAWHNNLKLTSAELNCLGTVTQSQNHYTRPSFSGMQSYYT